VVTGRHDAPQPTQRLKVAGEHTTILVVRGGDGWLARRRQFGLHCHVGKQRRGDLGEERTDRHAPSISNDGAVMDWQAGSHAKMGRGQCRAGSTAEKTAHNDFFHFKSFFQLKKSTGENKNRRNAWGLKKCEILHGDRFEYLPQLLYWAL
jgi:hypothetical protein